MPLYDNTKPTEYPRTVKEAPKGASYVVQKDVNGGDWSFSPQGEMYKVVNKPWAK